MKKFIILIIFSLSLSLYSGSELFPFGMNHTVYEQWNSFEDIEYREKYKGSMNWTAAAGVKWWRPQYVFTWYSVQPDPEDENCWDFETEDLLVKWAGERGLHLLPSIGYTAGWARHPVAEPLSKENEYRYPPDPTKWYGYRKYIDTLVERYDGDGINDMPGLDSLIPIKYWECMNEPFGRYFLGTPEQYVEMFESTWVALKEADPDAKIMGPCMTIYADSFKWMYFDTNSNSIKDSTFGYTSWQDATSSIIRSIGLDNIDIVSHHTYNNIENFMKYTIELRDTLKQIPGGENKPIWITETGFNRANKYTGERGTNNNSCDTSLSCVTYSSDSGEIFWDSVLVKRGGLQIPCTTMVDTFLNIGDTVDLYNRVHNAHDKIIYNGGPLIYKKDDTTLIDTALIVGDTLRICDLWDEEDRWHNELRQDSLYSEFLDTLIKTPGFLENLKVFFFDVNNSMVKYAYPPRIEFGIKDGDTTTRYHREYLREVYSVIDTNNDPFDAYYTIQDYILDNNGYIEMTEIDTNETKTYQAMDSLIANDFRIKGNGSSGGKVAMEAGDKITLIYNFRVEEGGYFHAAINPLYGESGMGMSSMIVSKPKKIKTPDKKESKDGIPKVFSCAQNYPNPFVQSTIIKYGLQKDVKVELEIYNLLGQKVRTLVNAQQSAGYKQVSWDGRTSDGKTLPKGIYFYTFKAGDYTKHRKMILLK